MAHPTCVLLVGHTSYMHCRLEPVGRILCINLWGANRLCATVVGGVFFFDLIFQVLSFLLDRPSDKNLVLCSIQKAALKK